VGGLKLLPPAPKLTSHPVDVGLRTEGSILARLAASGYRVLVPFGVNQRFDLVLYVAGAFIRAQCKTGRLRKGVILFSTQSMVTSKTRNVARSYAGEADIFLVYCPDTESIYGVPVELAPRSYMSLRVDPCRNGQCQRVNWARDYELPA
jgi:hypothetical protein